MTSILLELSCFAAHPGSTVTYICCGTMEQVRETEGTLNTLNFNKKKYTWHFSLDNGQYLCYNLHCVHEQIYGIFHQVRGNNSGVIVSIVFTRGYMAIFTG